ncbi:hypothetical protein ACPOL_3785 [Acidisarcina polymorpha]|uniref:Uncharacterized protein n=1 Tax=Acidisarcina polymorpha TaxID=2211140 RepID=A0A2Z5G2M8_9BACT|nr:hypothetical protein [Acidisarcina polymorpha]AXC13064.1 hypothetical protein ACPOL_3785 [Acidisarcina polymorpha]
MKRLLALVLILVASQGIAQSKPSLLNVRKIYVEKMDDNLDHYLTSEISRKFHGNMTVVLDRSQADAILRGVSLGAQNTSKGTVELVDPSEKVVLWSGTAGDRDVKFLAMKHGGEEQIAEKLVAQMKKAMQP